MKLCLGTTIKLICLCARKGMSNVRVGNKLFPDYEFYSKKQTIINDPLVGKWKACTNELSQEYCNAILDTDVEINKSYFAKIAEEIFNSVIEPDKESVFLASLIRVIESDDDISNTTIIGFDTTNTKQKIIREQNIDKIQFFSNILYYIHVAQNNKEGKDYIKKIDEQFIQDSAEKAKDLFLISLGSNISSVTKKTIPDRKQPFTYYSNSSLFVGRKKEITLLEQFVNSEETCISWFSVSGPGGSGKSRLAYELKCSLERRGWDTYEITRDTGLSFEILTNIISIGSKNVFIVVDIEIADMEPLARWMSYQYSKRPNVRICVLICQRLRKKLSAEELAPWYASIANYNEMSSSFEFKAAEETEIYLDKLDFEDLKTMALSYLNAIYPSFKVSQNNLDYALKMLDKTDPNYHRPLYLLFISDAIANNAVSGINSEDSLLNYAFLRERNYIRNIIKDAFGCDYTHNKKLYDIIERNIAEASQTIFLKKYRTLSGAETVGMSDEQFRSITDTYGLTTNGEINIIEPDLLAEYFYIRYSSQFGGNLAEQEFWVALYRDFNYLITTRYRDFQHQFFPYSNMYLGLYYIQGVYEAFCMSDSKNERERLTELIDRFEDDFKEWIGNDSKHHPFGPEFAFGMFFMTQGERLNKIRSIMHNSIDSKQGSLPKQKYDMYDSMLGNQASKLYGEMEELIRTANDAALFIDKLNDFTQLFEKTLERDCEVPFYYAHALFGAVIFFFGRGLEYNGEIVSQIARMVPSQLMRIYDIKGTQEALMNYIKTLMTFFKEDDHDYYKGKEELLNEIVELNNKYGDNPNLQELFISFFQYIVNDSIK